MGRVQPTPPTAPRRQTAVGADLQDLAELAAGVLDPPASCGARATLLDETQYGLGEGRASCTSSSRPSPRDR